MKLLKHSEITPTTPQLTQAERAEMEQLSWEIFGQLPPRPHEPSLQEKADRYKFLARKKQDCMQALMN